MRLHILLTVASSLFLSLVAGCGGGTSDAGSAAQADTISDAGVGDADAGDADAGDADAGPTIAKAYAVEVKGDQDRIAGYGVVTSTGALSVSACAIDLPPVATPFGGTTTPVIDADTLATLEKLNFPSLDQGLENKKLTVDPNPTHIGGTDGFPVHVHDPIEVTITSTLEMSIIAHPTTTDQTRTDRTIYKGTADVKVQGTVLSTDSFLVSTSAAQASLDDVAAQMSKQHALRLVPMAAGKKCADALAALAQH